MWSNLLIFSFISYIFISCAQKSGTYDELQFNEVIKINKEIISDELIIGYPYQMFADYEYIFIVALTNNTWVQAFNRYTGEYVGGYINNGQGPGEATSAFHIFYDHDSHKLSVFDQNSMKMNFYKITDDKEALISYVYDKGFVNTGSVIRRVWGLSENSFLVDGQMGEKQDDLKRFQLIKSDSVFSEFNELPISSVDKKMAFLSPEISISPDKTKMAVGTLFGGVLEYFSLVDDIKREYVGLFYEPHFKEIDGLIRPTSETIFGFSTLCASNDLVYTVLIADKDPDSFRDISVFNWDGKGVCKYETDSPVFKMCFFPEDYSKVYAIVLSEEGNFILVSYNLY